MSIFEAQPQLRAAKTAPRIHALPAHTATPTPPRAGERSIEAGTQAIQHPRVHHPPQVVAHLVTQCMHSSFAQLLAGKQLLHLLVKERVVLNPLRNVVCGRHLGRRWKGVNRSVNELRMKHGLAGGLLWQSETPRRTENRTRKPCSSLPHTLRHPHQKMIASRPSRISRRQDLHQKLGIYLGGVDGFVTSSWHTPSGCVHETQCTTGAQAGFVGQNTHAPRRVLWARFTPFPHTLSTGTGGSMLTM